MAGDVCDVCEREGEEVAGVAAIPGVPVSCAYCITCLKAGAWGPVWAAETTIDQIGGLANAADWFKEMLIFKDGKYVTVQEGLADYEPQDMTEAAGD